MVTREKMRKINANEMKEEDLPRRKSRNTEKIELGNAKLKINTERDLLV